MKTIFSSVAVATALAVLAATTSPALGQQPGYGAGPAGQPAGGPATRPAVATAAAPVGVNGIAIVDVAYIFKNYEKFKRQMEGMKLKVEAAEGKVRKEQESMKSAAEQLKQLVPGGADYKRLEADLLKKQADMNLEVNLAKKDFMEQEAKIYFNISREIDDAVKLLATQYNVVLVLRFNGDPVDAQDRNEILRGINKAIVFYDQRMDITPYVLQNLNRSAGLPVNNNSNTTPVPVGGLRGPQQR